MTSPRQSPAALQSDEVLRLFIEGAPDYAIFVLDPQGRVATWNLGAERMKGYKADEIIGKELSTFYTPAEAAGGKAEYELRTAAEKGRYQEEGWRVRKDGSRFWASVTLVPIRDHAGKLLGFGKITRDLTERRQSEQRYRLLVESVLDYAIFSMDATGHIGSWNIGAERLKGYRPDEIIGKHFSVFYTEEDRKRDLPGYVLRTAVENGHFEGEGWRVRKDGSLFWASVVVTPLRDEEGNLYGFSKVTRDVTERKKLLDTLQRHADELELRIREREEINAELEAFAYSVSHDLRAPLRAVSGFADALREDCGAQLDDTGLAYLDEIAHAARRMSNLVQDLLDYGRVSRVEIALEEVPLGILVNDAAAQVGDRAGGSLRIDVPPEVHVRAHSQLLRQILFNLLSNAFKFRGEAPPVVEVAVEQRDGFVRLSVRDNGIGIAPQYHDRIWNVFERLHDRDTYPGTGIGLAIVKRGILRMGGRCGVDSEPGRGSTFWIELPAGLGGERQSQSHDT